jgi:glycine cleavage system H lipoate-binding protein
MQITVRHNLIGWLFKVELSNKGELKSLMNEEQYDEFLKTQEH